MALKKYAQMDWTEVSHLIGALNSEELPGLKTSDALALRTIESALLPGAKGDRARELVFNRVDGVLGVAETYEGPTVVVRQYRVTSTMAEGFDPSKV